MNCSGRYPQKLPLPPPQGAFGNCIAPYEMNNYEVQIGFFIYSSCTLTLSYVHTNTISL